MVQGVSRQVIVVRTPDPRFFEGGRRLPAEKYPVEQGVAAGARPGVRRGGGGGRHAVLVSGADAVTVPPEKKRGNFG